MDAGASMATVDNLGRPVKRHDRGVRGRGSGLTNIHEFGWKIEGRHRGEAS